MKLSSVVLARLVALVEIDDLMPRHKLLPVALSKALVERYGFLKAPEKYEDIVGDPQKGIRFELGAFDETVITSLGILTGGIVVETGSSTEDAELFLQDVLTWARDEFGIAYEPGMIKRRGYLSQLVFTSDVPLTAINPKLNALAERITRSVSAELGHPFSFELNSVGFGYDTTYIKTHTPIFIVERRADIPYSENKYFSSAPVSTSEHIELIEAFEDALKS